MKDCNQTEFPFPGQSAGDSHVPTSALPGKGQGLSENSQVSGRRCFDSSEMYGQRGQLLKMYQPFDLRGLPWSFKISARSGIAVNGIAYPLVPLALLTRGTASGSWPTPVKSDHLANDSETLEAWEERAKRCKEQGVNLQFALRHAVQKWPTPTSRDWKDGSAKSCKNVPANSLLGREVHARENYQTSGSLNPTWVEWLMGFPAGWTDLSNSGTP